MGGGGGSIYLALLLLPIHLTLLQGDSISNLLLVVQWYNRKRYWMRSAREEKAAIVPACSEKPFFAHQDSFAILGMFSIPEYHILLRGDSEKPS